MMERCPICHRFGFEYDPYVGKKRCLWNDCSPRKKETFKKFARSIKIKKD